MSEKHNYKSIYAIIRERIEKGGYADGTLLPPESVLAAEYGVSRPTIAKVYNRLEKEHMVNRKRGRGTQVNHAVAEKDTYTFGLLLPGAGESEIFATINNRLLGLSKEMGFDCLWDGATASNADIRRNLIELCCENYIRRNVDGIFFSPLERVSDAGRLNLDICRRVEEAGIPLVLIDRDIVAPPARSRFDVVGLDNYNAATEMARLMIKAGCKNIYFFYRPYTAYSAVMRLRGVRDAVLEAGLYFLDNNVVCGNPENTGVVAAMPIIKGNTGIVCVNDATAAVLMLSLETLGYKCGTDYLLCGFDDMKYSCHLKCALSSYTQPCDEIAEVSVELMMRRVENKDCTPLSVMLSGRVVERESTEFAPQM